jgi:hypothetical protein
VKTPINQLLSLLICLLFTTKSFAGDPDILYYISDGDNTLYSINRTDGTVTLIGAAGVSNIEALAYYPVPGFNQLFATDAGNFGSLDLTTGAFSLIGEVDGGGTANGASGPQSLDDVDGLMLDGQTFKMWAVERKAGATPDLLFQIDVTTGQFVRNAFGPGVDYLVISGTGIDVDVDDLAVDPTTGRIYATSNNGGTGDVLIEINKYTGVFSFIATLSQDDVEGLAFHNDGTLYGSEGDGDNRLGEINLSTGLVSNFFSFTGSDVEGLASLVANANTLSGTVYEDDDLDGVKDGGEGGLANVRVYLYQDNNGDGKVDPEDTRIQSTLTDGNGDYAFYYAATGSLLVSTQYASYPSTYALTTDNVESASFTDGVNFNETDTGNDFGLGTGPDCDGDGIPNFYEGGGDADLDAVPDSCDLDSDNDGIRDDVEGIEDFDDDGIPDYLDRDADDDGIPDAIEANQGIIPSEYVAANGNMSGTDLDGNGIIDSRETAAGSGVMIASNPDSDNDGRRDYRDLDSDNDGILDIIEAGGSDADGDGQVDSEVDADGDGYKDLLQSTPLDIPNTDSAFESGNGLTLRPDYIDIDSDADGIDDTREAYSTAAYTFPTLLIDSDDDGIVDFWDISTFNTPITPYDRDGDGTADYQDTDSDNDGVLDAIEGNDSDNDGVADLAFANTDDNENGLDDAFDADCATSIEIAAADYAEETNSSGSINLASSDLEFCNDGGTVQTVGVYFSGVPVDQNKNIQSAYIQFETDEVSTGAISVTIEGQLIGNAASFTSTTNDVTSRSRTTNSETWNPADWNTIGEASSAQLSVDISSIVQELVDQGTWANGNNMVYIFSGPGGNRRTAEVDPILIINTDAIVCSSVVAVQDFDGDGERDWRDNDDDDDGIPTISEIPDNDANGTPDYLESNLSACGLGFLTDTIVTNQSSSTGAVSQTNSGVSSPANALGVADNIDANVSSGDNLVLFFGDTVPSGSSYTVTWARQNAGGSSSVTMTLEESMNGVSFTTNPTAPSTSSKSLISSVVTANSNFQYLRITSSSPGLDVDAVVVTVNSSDTSYHCVTDTDGDGIADADDIDDDNDGILDTVEARACTGNMFYEFYDGVPGGNTVDSIPYTGALGTGSISSFDVDAIQTAVDPGDADSYAIRFKGFISIATSETYTFYTTSDDGSKLYIDGAEVVDNDGDHAAVEQSGTIALTPGVYYLEVLFYENGGSQALSVSYSSASISKTTIPFSVLSNCDSDGDGVPNHLDLDSDNDGIPDIIEAGGVDSDANGRVDNYTDTDGDGWSDTFDADNGGSALGDADMDGDGLANRIDLDSDDDGIADIIEAGGTDSDNDGRADSSTDSDGDGWSSTFDADEFGTALSIPDTDGDGLSNYLDLDSDSDGITDNVEGQSTADFQAPLGTDTDGDGWDDRYDSDNGGTAISLSNFDGADDPDYIDLDSDNDGFPDWLEGFDDDEDGDALNDFINRADLYETLAGNPMHYVTSDDADNDGVPDFLEDSDGDGTPNFLDSDSPFFVDEDGDGEVNLFDADNNGAISVLPNEDADGEPNFRDQDDQVTLPVTLLDFSARKKDDVAILSWRTLTEINNDYFIVERSTDGKVFQQILTVKGHGNSNREISYSIIDEYPENGYNYYRLTQVDFDGKQERFDDLVRVLEFQNLSAPEISLYPNPSNGSELFLEVDRPEAGEYQIEILSIEGQLIAVEKVNIEKETIYFEQNVLRGLKLSKGLYYLNLRSLKSMKTQKFIVY